jgi:glycosyltransferase involved in cell wall biosynthesis
LSARLTSLSFFFPALNEEDHVEAVVRDALAVLPRFADDVEVTVIDDGSTDRTGKIADDLAKADPRVRVVHHGARRGYGGAVRSGLLSARKDFIFFTDGDRQFQIADLERLIPAMEGVDAVMGYRLKRQDPARARFVALVYNLVIRVMFFGGFRDVDCAFKLFRHDVFERVPLKLVRSNGAFFSAEMLITLRRAGIRTREVGVPHYPRTAGKAKGQQPKVILRAIRDLLRLRLRLWGLPL